MDDAIKAAEKNGYSKGYSAGQVRGRKDGRSQERKAIVIRDEDEFWDKAFLVAMANVIDQSQEFTSNGAPLTSPQDRLRIAALYAGAALIQRRQSRPQ